MPKFIHAADIHLDSPLLKLAYYDGAPVEAIRNATRKALENLVNLAIAESVDFMLIAGDLYDSDWKDYNTGLFFVSQMARLREYGVRVLIVSGNHDAGSRMTRSLRLPDNVHFFSTESPESVILEHIGVAVHGQGFSNPYVKIDLSACYPAPVPHFINIGMLHTSATGRPGHEPYAPCTREGLVNMGYDYWALGHIHQREILSQIPLIVFPGNIQGRHIRETGPKGCIVVQTDPSISAIFQSCDVIRWELVAMKGENSLTDLMDQTETTLIELCRQHRGIPLIIRLKISAGTILWQKIHQNFDQFKNDLRSLSIDVSGGQIWIQDIHTIRLSHDENLKQGHGTDPLGELHQMFRELEMDSNQILTYSHLLDDLITRLPRELREGPDAIRPNDPEWLSAAINEVESMLTARLLTKNHP
jgi:DNA repair exonuclease SbcCD nuclease subunit